jgi:O-antigen/teichoic acid export membrane protein
MGLIIRQSVITSAFSYLGVVIGYFNVLWLFPKILQPEEIGLVRVMQDMAILMTPFAQMGFSQSLLKFFPVYDQSPKERNAFFSIMLLGALASYVVFLIIFSFFKNPFLSIFSERSPLVVDYFPLTLALLFILVATAIFEAYSRSLLKVVAPNFIKEVVLRALTSLIILAYFLDLLNLTGLLVSLVSAYAAGLFILALYLFNLDAIKITFSSGLLKKVNKKEILRYSLFALFGSGGILIVQKIDSIMITSLVGLTQNGVYTTCFYIAIVIEMPRRAVTQIVAPLISKAFESQNLDEIKSLYQKSSINQLIVGILLLTGIWANIDFIFFLIPNWQQFEAGKMVVLIIGLSRLIDMAAGINSEIIVMSKFYRFNIFFISLLAMAAILTNYLLIPILGIDGAALASALSMALFNLVKFIFIYQKFGMQPFSINTLKIIIVGIIVYYTSLLTPHFDQLILSIFVRSAYIALVLTGITLLLKISPEANRTLLAILSKIKK